MVATTPPQTYDQSAYQAMVEKYLKQMQGDKYVPPEQRQKGQAAGGKSGGGSSAGTAIGSGALVLGSAYLRSKLADYLRDKANGKVADEVAKQITPTPLANSNITAAGNDAWNAGANAASRPTPIASTTDGVIMSDGSAVSNTGTVTTADGVTVTPDGNAVAADGSAPTNYGQYLTYASYALAAKNAMQALRNDNLSTGQKASAVGQAGLGAYQAYNAANGGGYSTGLSAIGAALGAYDALSDDNLTGEQAATKAQQNAATAMAGPYAPIVAFANNRLRTWGATKGYMNKLDRLDQKTNPATWAIASFMSHKDADQMARDRYRSYLKDSGLVDDAYAYTDQNGRKIDFGADGSARLQNMNGANIDGETDRGTYDVDFTNKLAGQTVGYLNPLASIQIGGNQGRSQKLQNDATGMLVNAALNGATDQSSAQANALNLFKRSGYDTADKAIQALSQYKDQLGDTYDAQVGGIRQVFAGAPAPQPQPSLTNVPTTPYRSSTRSPGIGKDGKPIRYAR